MGFFTVTFKTESLVPPAHGPERYLLEYDGTIRYFPDDDEDGDESSVAGKIRAFRIQAVLALEHGLSPILIGDEHSEPVFQACKAVYDGETGSLQTDLSDKFEVLDDDCVYLDYIVLNPRWRGLKVGLTVAQTAIEILGSGSVLVVSDILPLNRSAARSLKIPSKWIPANEGPEAQKEARLKLRQYFKQIGF